MFKKLLENLRNAKTKEEILSYRTEVCELQEQLLKETGHGIYTNQSYDVIKLLYDAKYPMMSYYGVEFFTECGIPFLKEHDPEAIAVIEIVSLFYIMQVIDLLEKGYFEKVRLCKPEFDAENGVQYFCSSRETDLTKGKYKKNLFVTIMRYFLQVIMIEKDNHDKDRNIAIDYIDENEEKYKVKYEVFYLDDEEYEKVIDLIYDNYKGSSYANLIEQILGRYKMRFTKMEYIMKYQPMFVQVAYDYMDSVLETEEEG